MPTSYIIAKAVLHCIRQRSLRATVKVDFACQDRKSRADGKNLRSVEHNSIDVCSSTASFALGYTWWQVKRAARLMFVIRHFSDSLADEVLPLRAGVDLIGRTVRYWLLS